MLATGFRFDLSTAAMWALPTFLLSIAVTVAPVGRALSALRMTIALCYAALAMLTFGTDLVFFSEYNDQFNQHIFGIFHDDTTAILITVWKEYHPIPVAIAIALFTWAALRLVRRWLTDTPTWWARLVGHGSTWNRVSATVLVFLAVAAAARGGTLWGEPILLKHAFVVNDLFLNRTVINPFTALAQAVETKARAEMARGGGGFWPEEDLLGAVATVRNARGATSLATDLDDALASTARGTATPPRHVFLLLLESHDGWTVHPAYRDLGFSPEIAALADRGVYFPNFVPSAAGTIGSMNALMTGLPEVGLNINYEASALRPYPAAIAENFRRLGFRTRFFYGGYLGWQRLDNFAQSQGFEEIWGGGSMAKPGIPTNEWGVADEYLFDFILDTVAKDERPSFNFVLTTSNHPPWDLDLKAQGFPMEAMPSPLEATKDNTLRVLGHLWYTDRQVGRFVTAAEQRLPPSLFAITGDHTTRLNIGFPGGGAYEHIGVPMVLYGPQVLPPPHVDRRAGSHIDIPPTLYELSAPAGFRYYAFGRDLLTKQSPSFGLGYQYLIGEGYLAAEVTPPALFAVPGGELPVDTQALLQAKREFDALRALGWQRVRKGPALPTMQEQGTSQRHEARQDAK